jgi:sulfonate transport system permease protein
LRVLKVIEYGFNWVDGGLTIWRWFVGLMLGIVLSLFWIVFSLSLPWLSRTVLGFLRSLPILGIMPFVQLWFGPSDIGKAILVAWACSFPIWLSVVTAILKSAPDDKIAFQLALKSRINYLRHYCLPVSLIGFRAGIGIAVGFSWLVVMAAELMGVYSQGFFAGGVGYKLYLHMSVLRWELSIQCLLFFGVCGAVSAWVWAKVQDFIFKFFFGVTLGDGLA